MSHARKNIYVIGFPPSPPPPFRRIDFYCPPRPSLKPLPKKSPLQAIYI